MKTAERILLTALELFNDSGESNVSCVDLALELDISPGNLYYHYKGKEVIVVALFEMYKERMDKILSSPQDVDLKVEEFFYYLLMVLQGSHMFRFLYHNPADLIAKYPSVCKGFRRLILGREKSFNMLLSRYIDQGAMELNASQQHYLVRMISLVFTQATNYYLLKGDDIESESYIYECLGDVLFALTPYMKVDQTEIASLCAMIEREEL